MPGGAEGGAKMKKLFKLSALILAAAMLVSVIPLGLISSSAEEAADVLLNDFDSVTDAGSLIFSADLNTQVTVGLNTEHRYTESGNSLEITTVPASSAGYRRARITPLNATDSSAAGFKLWIKNPTEKNISIAVQFINKKGTWINMKANSPYYTVDSLGEVSQRLYHKKISGENEGCIIAEAGFEGFFYLPFTSGHGSAAKATDINMLVLNAYTEPQAPVAYYIDELSTYGENPGETLVIRRFSEYDTTAQMKAQMYISGTHEVTLDAEKDACVINTGAIGTTSNLSFNIGKEAMYQEHTGMRVRLEASNHSDTKILFKWEAKEHRPLKSKAVYYLIDQNGNIYSKKATADSVAALVTVPAGFNGWLYVPFASAYPMTYSDIYRLYLNPVIEDVPGRSLWVYEISLYNDLPIKEGAAYVINDFEDYADTSELKKALVYGDTTALTLDLKTDVWDSKSLSILQNGEKINGSTAVEFGASEITGRFTGFKVRMKVNKNSVILLKSEDAQHRPMKPGSLYYLASSDGRTYSYKASTDSAAYIQLKAGFDGWVYIPFSSLYDIDLSKAYRLWFAPESANESGTEFIIDDVVLYSGNPTAVNSEPIAFERVLPYNPEETILDFDSCTSAEDMEKKIKLHKMTDVTAELDTAVAQNKNSAKFTFSEKGGKAETIVEFEKNSYFSEITGFKFWIKASEGAESVSLLYKLETSIHRPIKRSAVYYLVDKNGNVKKSSASASDDAALISVPAGFEGWMYVPFSSIYPMEIKELYRIWFILTATENASKNIWIDSIGCYTDNPIASNPELINNFDYYSGTADILLDSRFQSQGDASFEINGTYRDGNSGKSLKINTVKSNYKFMFDTSVDRAQYDGFTFYVNNPSTSAVKLLPQTDSKGRDSFVPGRAYYLESLKTGAVTMERFEKIVADAGNISVPAGFEGFVYLPYSSAYPSLQNNVDKLNAFWLNVPDLLVAKGSVYLDTIAFYKNSTCRISSTLMWKQDTVGMLYGFEKNNSIAGYRGWISAAEGLNASIDKTYSHSGTNSLKISSDATSMEGIKDSWLVTTLSLKNEDGTYNDMSMYDGIAFWIKVERDGTDTKPEAEKVSLGVKVNMPSHGRLYSTSPIYVLKDGGDTTEPDVFTNAQEGCTAVTLQPGFSGMLYIPFSTLESFANEQFGVTEGLGLTDIFIMFRQQSLIGYNVYIDDVQGFNMKNLTNVNWPGDADYDPLSDPMLQTAVYVGSDDKGTSDKTDILTDNDEKSALPAVIAVTGGIAAAVAACAVIIILKKKKSQKKS